jgi:hypothetical protein
LANSQSEQIVRNLGAWFATSLPHLNVKAFMSIKFRPEDRTGKFRLKVVSEQARRLRGWSMVDTQPAGVAFGSHHQRRFRLPDED